MGLNSLLSRDRCDCWAPLSIYACLLRRLCEEAAHLCGTAAAALWLCLRIVCGLPVFRLEGVWGFSKRCVRHSGGVWASDPRRSFHDSPLAVSQSLLFGLARGAHRRLRRERTPQYSSRSPRRTYWLLRRSKTSPHTAHQRALLERCSHIQARPHDSIAASAARATTSLGCGIRSATATSVGARIRPNRQ